MKAQHILFLLLFSSLLINSKCRKENEPELPPETTIGANTFGCKIDGKVFIAKGSITCPALIVEYIFFGNGPGGGWVLNISAAKCVGNPKQNVGIQTDSLLLLEGTSYPLKKLKGYAYGDHLSSIIPYGMNSNDRGELYISKHDQAQRILSGRFYFTATNQNGEKVTITEGRFDVRY
jgi:hypothetical protein